MKKTTIISLVSVLAVSGSQAALVDGLVNYWPLDGNANDAAHGLAGSSSTVADNGTFDGANGTGGISYDTGLFGQGTLQDGAAGGAAGAENNGFIRITQSADTNFGGESLTISLWAQVGTFDTGWQALIAAGEGSNYRIARRASETGVGYAGGVGEGPNTVPHDLTGGNWHHILATTENGVATNLYVDGVLVSTGGVPTIVDDAVGIDLFIGANPDTGAQNREWNGKIDDVAQWNRVLDASEIASLYGGGAGSASSLGALIAVPEPSSVALIALAGFGFFRRRR